jgi:ESF2/ABP1 family protein
LTPIAYLDLPAHEAATHAAKLRVELAQSKSEQRDYLKNVELARVLDKRAKRKRAAEEGEKGRSSQPVDTSESPQPKEEKPKKKSRAMSPPKISEAEGDKLKSVLGSIF